MILKALTIIFADLNFLNVANSCMGGRNIGTFCKFLTQFMLLPGCVAMFLCLELFIYSASRTSSDQMINVGIMAFPFHFILKRNIYLYNLRNFLRKMSSCILAQFGNLLFLPKNHILY